MLSEMNRGFKRKTIINIIQSKINHWVKSIDDKTLVTQIKDNYILTGGAIVSLLQGEMPNDYDIYFRDFSTAKAVAEYYTKKLVSTNDKVKIKVIGNEGHPKIVIKSAGVVRGEGDSQQDYDYFEGNSDPNQIESYLNKDGIKSGKKYEIAMITSNAISLTGDIQLVLRFVGEPEDIHKNYDFLHVTNYFTEKDGLVLKAEALEVIMSKTIKYVGSLYPICSMFRLRKFIQRGWSVSAGEMLKIAFDINKLNLNDMSVLYEQLVGVDAAYFNQLIGMMKEFQEKNGNINFDRSYFFELINKVFENGEIDHDDETLIHMEA